MSTTPDQTVSPLIRKLEQLSRQYQEMQDALNDPAIHANPQKLIAISKQSGQLEPMVSKYHQYLKTQTSVAELQQLAENKADAEMAEMAAAELPAAQAQAAQILEELKDELVAAEDNAVDSFFLEILCRHRRRRGRAVRPRSVRDVSQLLRNQALAV